MFTWLKKRDNEFADDEPDVSIIDAVRRQENITFAGPGTMPIPHIPHKPDPPSRQDRSELHITGPQRAHPYVNGAVRPNAGRVLLASRETLPTFHAVADMMGWRGLIPPPKPSVMTTGAMRSIEAYTDKTLRVLCQQAEACRAELWERARDYDLKETEFRLQHPLTGQNGM